MKSFISVRYDISMRLQNTKNKGETLKPTRGKKKTKTKGIIIILTKDFSKKHRNGAKK